MGSQNCVVHKLVQLHCGAPWIACGGLSESTPYDLSHNPLYSTETAADGFFWIHIFDFHAYFECIHECRLVNSGDRGAIPNMPAPRLPYPVTPCYINAGTFNVSHCSKLHKIYQTCKLQIA